MFILLMALIVGAVSFAFVIAVLLVIYGPAWLFNLGRKTATYNPCRGRFRSRQEDRP
jgi:hypothetical protein